MILPLSNAERCARFGRFAFEPAPTSSNPEGIAITDGWVAANIVTVTCPQLARFNRKTVQIHRAAADSFVKLWAEWDRLGLLNAVSTWNGSFVPRFKRGRAGGGEASLSNHSWGTAFDICAKDHPLGRRVPTNALIRHLVPVAESLGWFWGGNFRSRPDGMHFEFVGDDSREKKAARALIAGGLTREQVIAAQRLIGVTADGIPGPLTMTRARAVLAR